MQPAGKSGTGSSAHQPVMLNEVCALICARAPQTVLDATVGMGGHSAAILSAASGAWLLGMDCDAGAIAAAAERLHEFGERISLHHANFMNAASILEQRGIKRVGAVLADLGMSSFALDDPRRGFSYRADGPLDMRMDFEQPLRAYQLVNEEPEAELARIIYRYGEERASRRIARAIAGARRRRPLATTYELRGVIEGVMGRRKRGGIHPATRTFQALRIAVNHEIESLKAFLNWAPLALAPGGRLVILAYHSLEDRPVKERFRELVRSGEFIAVTGKAMRPQASELAHNPRARSARLRCIERSLG